MSTPCRASTCDHLQCFDASLYLMMNEKKPKWICPVCNKAALYENLLIDGYFTDVLTSKRLPHDEHEIVLKNDASWDPLVPAKKPEGDVKPKLEALASPPSPTVDRLKKESKVETLDIEDDDEPLPPAVKRPLPAAKPISKEVDYVTLDSDDEEEEIAPPSKKARTMQAFLDDDSTSNSVSSLGPTMVTPPARNSPPAPSNTTASVANGNQSPLLICLDDDD